MAWQCHIINNSSYRKHGHSIWSCVNTLEAMIQGTLLVATGSEQRVQGGLLRGNGETT